MDEGTSLDFNYWASFADLMLALVLVLALLLFVVVAVISFNTVNLKEVKDNQSKITNAIAAQYRTKSVLLTKDDELKRELVGISTTRTANYDIKIQTDLNVQRITFTDKLLFGPDETEVNLNGQKVLTTVGKTLKNQLSFVKEIQIEGHADTLKSGRFRTNTELAAMRALAVFEFFQQKTRIDPNKTLMSTTSFGEYKSVNRGDHEDSAYNRKKLENDNRTEDLRSINRRIEIVLIYRREKSEQK